MISETCLLITEQVTEDYLSMWVIKTTDTPKRKATGNPFFFSNLDEREADGITQIPGIKPK